MCSVIGSRCWPRMTSTRFDSQPPCALPDEEELFTKRFTETLARQAREENGMCQVHHNARAFLVASSAAPVILSKLSRCSVAKTINGNPLLYSGRYLGDENDARTLRARVQQLLIHVVMLPVVWVSVCCVFTAAMGIECVESLQNRLLSAPTDGELNQRPTKKTKRSVRDRDSHADRQRLSRVHHRDDASEDDAVVAVVKKQKTTKKNEPVLEERASDPKVAAHLMASRQRSSRPRKRRVIIWDLDETLVLFASLCSGQFARTHSRDVATSVALGEQMMTYLLAVLERHFHFSDLHDADVDHITSASCNAGISSTESSDQPIPKTSPEYRHVVAERYTHIRSIYDRCQAVDFLDDKTSQWFTARQALVAAIDGFSSGWIREAKEILALTAARRPAATIESGDDEEHEELVNVMVTNTQLSPALAKCLIYGLDQFFPIDCVYSSTKLHKLQCFQTIIDKYSKDASDRDVEFVGVGDGMEEEQVSQALGIGFFKIRSLHDLRQLRFELQLAPRPAVSP